MERENILDEIYDYVGRFISYPNEESKNAHVTWIAHTYLTDSLYATPRLNVLSATKRSGKTRLIEITKLLVRNPQSMISPTSSSIFRLTNSKSPPTLLIDEIGRLLEKKDISEFLNIVESGFQAGHPVVRTNPDTLKVESFNVYAPMLMAGIDNGRMPDTIEDRGITIRMKRNIGPRLRYRSRKHSEEGYQLAAKLLEWSQSVAERAKDLEPSLPDSLNDREQDKWEPLFVVAHLVTDVTDETGVTDETNWVERVQKAALWFSNEDAETEVVSISELLLTDIKTIIFDDISTETLLSELYLKSESPWSTYNHGKSISARQVGGLLKPYGIKSKTIRFERDYSAKGYYRSQFEDAWTRYIQTPSVPPVTRVTSVTPVTDPMDHVKANLPVPAFAPPSVGSVSHW